MILAFNGGATAVVFLVGQLLGAHEVTPSDSPPKQSPDIGYATVAAFWDRVEDLLKSKPEMIWSGGSGQYGGAGNVEERIKENLTWLSKLREVPLPQLKNYKRVRLFADTENWPESFFMGFLIAEEPDRLWAFTNRWRMEEVLRTDGTRLEEVDLAEELKIVIAAADSAGRERWPPLAQTAFQDGHSPHGGGVYFVHLAYLAHLWGTVEQVDSLLRAGFRVEARLLKRTFDEWAWQQFESAVLDLNAGRSRADLAARFAGIVKAFPSSQYDGQASEYARILAQMAQEDAAFRAPADVSSLPAAEQVKVWLFRLRDANAVQDSQPGHCWIPDIWGWETDGRSAQLAEVSAAGRLIDLGFDAVPALISALEDERLTRSYGFWRDFSPERYVLRVGDGAIQVLEVIAGRSFDPDPSQSTYLTREPPEVRRQVRADVEGWWKAASAQGEAAYLRAKLAEIKNPQIREALQYPERILRRLAIVEGERALPDIRAWGHHNWPGYNADYYHRLLRAGGAAVVPEVKDRSRPGTPEFDFGAALALHQRGLLDLQAYREGIYQGALHICRTSTERPLPLNVHLLVETQEPRSLLLAAGVWRVDRKAVRQGLITADKAKRYWWLTRTNDPSLNAQLVAQLLPLIQGDKPDADAATMIDVLLGKPLGVVQNSGGVVVNVQDLLQKCKELGLESATKLPWE